MSEMPLASVIIPTYNRLQSVSRLVSQLDDQSLDPSQYELIIVDDGSTQPVLQSLASVRTRCRLRVIARTNEGPAAARDAGARTARGRVLVMLDDDMQVGRAFLESHAVHHDELGSVVVLGKILPDPLLQGMPVFERFHARQLEALTESFERGTKKPEGTHLYTGNVSMPRESYLAAGGFDVELLRSEDRELGLRLQLLGARFVFSGDGCASIHSSDHAKAAAWLERALKYGVYDLRISRKYEQLLDANPWNFIFKVSPIVRPLYLASAVGPSLGRFGGKASLAASEWIDKLGLEDLALSGATVAFGMNYFSGVGQESGGALEALKGLLRHLTRRARGERLDGRSISWNHPSSLVPRNIERWMDLVRADHDCMRQYRSRYNGEDIARALIARNLVEKVGLQLMGMVRLMQVLREEGHTNAAKFVSRSVRHLYGSDIHYEADISPGVLIVHGMGICIGRDAAVGPGCVLFQNVTLGEGVDAETREVGSPRLGANVHVGPGAAILGPVTIGERSKIVAGALVTTSVPPASLVEPPEVTIRPRPSRTPPSLRS